jgi:cell division protein FtsQ
MTSSATMNRRMAPPSAQIRPGRSTRRRLLVRILIGLIVAAVLASGVWLVGFSSVLAAKHVTVTGAKTLDAAQIRSTAQVPMGVPLAREDLPAIARRVATLAPVAAAHVDRRWPDTIRVTVVERTPALAVRVPAGFLLVDHTGFGYLTATKLPENLMVADVDPANSRLLTGAGVVAAALPKQLREKVSQIQANSPDAIALVLKSGGQVNWGSPNDSALKAKVTAVLMKRRATTYDVSAPLSPTTR